MLMPEASVSTVNGMSKSGRAKTGADDKAPFNLSKATWACSVH